MRWERGEVDLGYMRLLTDLTSSVSCLELDGIETEIGLNLGWHALGWGERQVGRKSMCGVKGRKSANGERQEEYC